MMIKKILISALLSTIILFSGAFIVSANQGVGGGNQGSGGGNQGSGGNISTTIVLENPFGTRASTIPQFFQLIIERIILPIGGVLAVLAFIYSGFLYVTAMGNETKLKTANKALLYTAIGTAVLLGSWVIAELIATTINSLMP